MTARRTAATAEASKLEGRLVARPIYFEDLPEGKQTQCDIYTSGGQLLVAKGTMLTSEIRIMIAKRRGFQMVPAALERKAVPGSPDSEHVGKIAQKVLAELDLHSTHGTDEGRQRLRRRLNAQLEVRPLAVGQGDVVRVWARNLSEQGIGFIARTEITSDRIVIKLQRISVTAEIIRRRPIQKGFWDYGARLLGRFSNNL